MTWITICNDFANTQNHANPAKSLTSSTPARKFTGEVVQAQSPQDLIVSVGHGWAEGIKSQFYDFYEQIALSRSSFLSSAITEGTAICKWSN